MSAAASRHKRSPTVSLNALEATHTTIAANIANKGLTKIVSPLEATVTKYQGGAC